MVSIHFAPSWTLHLGIFLFSEDEYLFDSVKGVLCLQIGVNKPCFRMEEIQGEKNAHDRSFERNFPKASVL